MAANADAAIAAHYGRDRLLADIDAALRAAGLDPERLTASDLAPLDHFHGNGLAATRALLDDLPFRSDQRVLDIGCGIGGPARHVAERFGCAVTGIDLTPRFIEVAAILSARTGLAGRTRFQAASATALPFADASFHHAWSQNVVMNIADKAAFAAEAFRVLRPGGRFALAEVTIGDGRPVIYPTPWSDDGVHSHLRALAAARDSLAAAGFAIESVRDKSGEGRPPPGAGPTAILSPAVIMGDGARDKIANGRRNSQEGRIGAVDIIARKPEGETE